MSENKWKPNTKYIIISLQSNDIATLLQRAHLYELASYGLQRGLINTNYIWLSGQPHTQGQGIIFY